MALTDRKPRGLLRLLLRAPIWLYRARLGGLAGHRLLYLAHRGRRTGARREVVVETVAFDPAGPEAVVIGAWGGTPDWVRNLEAAPAIEVRVGARRWPAPGHRFLDATEARQTLMAYRDAHPHAWKRLAPRLGFPEDPADPRWPDVHAIAFTPAVNGRTAS
ncbi:nitroreductase family deazaflavin-dependent oxidoreductase [Amycolatopsis sp. 195334CR]|uniref:nitroreductase family deazaflavin-dependent oxidoreductase n=1 Tax=Amycolatopsis sp. 195334CR TaxID=2814588 RepID=UPI001A901D90|nr:nitroreductase family deazaflavin-dependent oxidoreductase [Amycolatopsis sp. 195334CR]MBN6038407.1 nitroreductase family deazaflavin-dependent oxidoreductase [Amycolatopsis sp. 195334CR]